MSRKFHNGTPVHSFGEPIGPQPPDYAVDDLREHTEAPRERWRIVWFVAHVGVAVGLPLAFAAFLLFTNLWGTVR